MDKMKIISTISLIIIAMALWECHPKHDFEEEDIPGKIISPPGMKRDTMIMINNFQAKLYFLSSCDAGPDCWRLPNGIGYGGTIVFYTDSLSRFVTVPPESWRAKTFEVEICNFPDSSILWKPKDSERRGNGCSCWDGEVEVMFNGVLHVEYMDSTCINGYLELSSLKKLTQ